MSIKYKPMRIPNVAYDNFLIKKRKMEYKIKDILGKDVRIPLTKVLIAISQNSVTIPDQDLLKLINKRKWRNL